jgi:pimeloyl-ACP methyl ester carboxylesterase
MSPVGLSEELHNRIAGSRLKIIPGGSHMVMLEQPQAVNALLESHCG